MELIVRIKEQQALRYEDFTGRDDQPQRIAKMGFVLLHGASTIYAEACGDYATRIAQLDPNYYYLADISVRCNQTRDGSRYFNDIRLNAINVL